MAATRPAATLADFWPNWPSGPCSATPRSLDGVTLASMHAAKGLEWDAVLLPGLVEGVMPIVHARTPGRVEEERRLLYVAVTRAREHLYLSWAGPGPAARVAGRRRRRRRAVPLPGRPAAAPTTKKLVNRT